MLKRISRLLSISGNEHDDQRSLHLIFLFVALISLLVGWPLIRNVTGPYVPFGFIVLVLVLLLLTYRNYLWPARIVTPLASFLLITRLMYSGGIHDDALGGYYFFLIVVGLMLGQNGLLLFGIISTAMVVIIGLAETSGRIATHFGPLTEPMSIATTALFMLGTTLALNYMILRLNRAAREAQHNEAAQVRTNDELRKLHAVLEHRIEERTAELDYSNQKLIEQLDRISGLQAKLRQEAIRDPLTGLFNRRHLDEMLPIELMRSKRANAPLTILMLDIDHFKQVNDTHGHQVGDVVLQMVGETLKTHVRAGDIVCRYGGEEFILIFPGMKNGDAHTRAETLCTMVGSQTITVDDREIHVTISIGGSVYPDDSILCEELIQLADSALYRAKQNGRNRVEFTSP
jgi:diguanylate cyclase (GGDEF)-like protein